MAKYILVTWPESQELMEKPWFNECHLAEGDKVGNSAYFVPEERLTEFTDEQIHDELMALAEGTTCQCKLGECNQHANSGLYCLTHRVLLTQTPKG